jgi:hypothetical protein
MSCNWDLWPQREEAATMNQSGRMHNEHDDGPHDKNNI